jgi:hypothetical protein
MVRKISNGFCSLNRFLGNPFVFFFLGAMTSLLALSAQQMLAALDLSRPRFSNAYETKAHTTNVRSERLSPPNIVIILADDLGFNDLGYSWTPGGINGRIETPRIDALSRRPETVIFSNLYSMPFCTPSRAALLTGVHPTRTGMHHFVILSSQATGLPLDLPLLPARLKSEFGYKTHCVGVSSTQKIRRVTIQIDVYPAIEMAPRVCKV